MESFEEIVNGVRNSVLVGSCAECTYGTSKAGQRFAILITKGVWYAVRVLMDEEHRQYGRPWTGPAFSGPPWIIRTEHLTWDGASGRARQHRQQLEQGRFLDIYKSISPAQALPVTRVMPSDCASHPDKYLLPGDLVQTDFWFRSNHEGIYVGNGQVVHVSGHGEGKEASVARVGRLCGHFVDKPDATIRVVVYRIRFQTPQNVVKTATDYANGQFRDGEYNLISKNCQHFATLCAVGFEECGDTKKILNYLMTLGILPGLVLLML